MQAPKYTITSNQTAEEDVNDGLSCRNPSWCVCFIRFAEPASMYGTSKGPFQVELPLIIENDCITVSVDRPKANPFKTATILLKAGQLYYPGCVAPGDWAFVWMADHQTKIDRIIEILNGIKSNNVKNITGSTSVNDWNSGLKFIGRVLDTKETDLMSANGARTIATQVDCQAFLELSSSVYYTFVAEALLNPSLNASPGSLTVPGAISVEQGLKEVFGDIAGKFLNYYEMSTPDNRTPDRVVAAMMAIILGVDQDSGLNALMPELPGSFNNAIGIPQYINQILNMPGATKLYQVMNYIGGLQQYNDSGAPNAWERFSPSLQGSQSVFNFTTSQCKGFIPYMQPPLWDNQSMWSILNQYLNEPINEIYTCLRVNQENKILPTVVVREKPFGTNLFYQLKTSTNTAITKTPNTMNVVGTLASLIQKKNGETPPTPTTSYYGPNSYNPDLQTRALYGNLPRWIISEKVITSVQTSANEAHRINFVQVYGTSANQVYSMSTLTPEAYKVTQFQAGNFVSDNGDIKRHGLRANIVSNALDFVHGSAGTLSPHYARMRADWFFNGHLKLSGSITLIGVTEPICEGDNCEVRGVLYHIESVSHNGSIDSSGRKMFVTTLQVSNGVIASSVSSDDQTTLPAYVRHRGTRRATETAYPGYTDMQLLYGHKDNRNQDGEYIDTKGKDEI